MSSSLVSAAGAEERDAVVAVAESNTRGRFNDLRVLQCEAHGERRQEAGDAEKGQELLLSLPNC